MEDIQNGVIRFIGDPLKRIKEDYLRALRYFRFFIQFSKKEHDEYVISQLFYWIFYFYVHTNK